MFILAFFLVGELCHTSGLIDIPTAPRYDIPGMWGGGLTFSFPLFNEDPNPNDDLKPDPKDFTMVFRYGFLGRGEVAVAMYTPVTYALSVSYLFKKEENNAPAFFAGIDDISYNTHLSTIGMSADQGFIEEKVYNSYHHRPWELFSCYLAMEKSFSRIFDFVLGIGRGRYIGYGWRSHIFNTDFFVLGDDYTNPDKKASAWAFGVFFGGAIKLPGSLELMAEMDGRDGNAGLRYNHRYFSLTLAIAKCEHFGNNRPWSPRFILGFESTNRFQFETPKVGSIECVIRDNTTKQLLVNSVVDIRELNKRYKTRGGTFGLSLPAGNYTITVSKPNYVDYITKVKVKPGIKTKLIFNLKKTEEALIKEAAFIEKEKNIKQYFEQGKIYYSEGKLDQAKAAFQMVLSLNPVHKGARDYLSKIEPRRQELIRAYTTEALSREKSKDLTRALAYWQKVLELDTNNTQAKAAIAKLQNQIAKPKKPRRKKAVVKKPTRSRMTTAEIDALYKKGVSYFTAEKYDEALKIFKRVLAYNPNHKGAREYKKRTEARIKILKSGG